MSDMPGTGSQLAVHGGRPVRSSMLPYGHHNIEEEDVESVVEVLRSDWITTGPKVDEFEEAMADFVGAKYAVSFSSGTAALHGAAFAAGLEPGDEAVTTPMTFCATANCVLYMGARPVFADICQDTLNINTDDLANRINVKTKAILPVDFAGHPVDLDEILKLANKNNCVVIEDAAHALGAEYKGRKVGSISDMTMFSFHPVKHITTGEGGMITTDNPEFARRMRNFRTHGIDVEARQRDRDTNGPWFYEMVDLGFNYRLADLGCALGISQLRRVPQIIDRRREIAGIFSAAFEKIPQVICPVEKPDVRNVWHIYPIRLDLSKLTAGRKEIFEALRAENIGVNVHYIPVHMHPYYQENLGHKSGDYPEAEAAYDALITLPLYHSMTRQDMDDVIVAVQRVVSHFANSN